MAADVKIFEENVPYAVVAPEVATAYIGVMTNIWPAINISGIEVRDIFNANGINNMTYLSIRADAEFGIYNTADAEVVAKVIDPHTKKPILDWVFGGPLLGTRTSTGTIKRMLVFNSTSEDIEMLVWFQPKT